jgi:hypothetical protein
MLQLYLGEMLLILHSIGSFLIRNLLLNESSLDMLISLLVFQLFFDLAFDRLETRLSLFET